MRQITRLLPAALCELRIPRLLTAAHHEPRFPHLLPAGLVALAIALATAPALPGSPTLYAQAVTSPAGARVNFAPRQGEGPVARLDPSDWAIRGPAREGVYLDAVGLKAAWMGTEQGELEAWVWPWKIMHHFDLLARFDEVGSEIALSSLARAVEVRPYGAQITYVHSRFTIRQTLFAEAADPVLVMLLEVDTSSDLTLVASFVPDLAPMWPAGMGGQYAFFDAAVPGYVLSESRRQVNAIVGSPDASRGSSAPAHQLAGAGAFEIPVSRDRAKAGPVVLVVTGGMEVQGMA